MVHILDLFVVGTFYSVFPFDPFLLRYFGCFENFHEYFLKNLILNTVLLLAFDHLSHAFGISWLCFLAGWAENWAKLYMQLPISAM